MHHAERWQWHNDQKDSDALPLLQQLRFEHLRSEGYLNLRCTWEIGCPVEIRPMLDAESDPDDPVHAMSVYKEAFQELFPGNPVPEEVGVPCCSQFAVRREAVLQHPREDYIRYRDWLLNTSLSDAQSGRVMEYTWHSKPFTPVSIGQSVPCIVRSVSDKVQSYLENHRCSALTLAK